MKREEFKFNKWYFNLEKTGLYFAKDMHHGFGFRANYMHSWFWGEGSIEEWDYANMIYATKDEVVDWFSLYACPMSDEEIQDIFKLAFPYYETNHINPEYLSEEQVYAIKKIVKDYPDTVFGGSLSLIANGLLKRKVGDLDIITKDNYYSVNKFYPAFRVQGPSASERFILRDNKIGSFDLLSFKLVFPILGKKLNVDVIWKSINTEYNIFYLDKTLIRIEKPMIAVDFKISYLKNNISVINFKKHLSDILEILNNASKSERDHIIDKLIPIISKSKFINERYDKTISIDYTGSINWKGFICKD